MQTNKNMTKVTKALIIAAGRGMRMNEHTEEIPKCLIRFGETTIIGAILDSLQRVGIKEVVIVTGYKENLLRSTLGRGDDFGLQITYVLNKDWHKKNGVSVLAARDSFASDEPFLLMMSDHIFSDSMLTELLAANLHSGEVLLAVDQNHDKIFDIDDAMKVVVEGDIIRNIGKELKSYNGIDCGLFKCTPALFDALEQSLVDGDCSLSDGCKVLIREEKFRALVLKKAHWIDIDTPQAFEYAHKAFNLKKS